MSVPKVTLNHFISSVRQQERNLTRAVVAALPVCLASGWVQRCATTPRLCAAECSGWRVALRCFLLRLGVRKGGWERNCQSSLASSCMWAVVEYPALTRLFPPGGRNTLRMHTIAQKLRRCGDTNETTAQDCRTWSKAAQQKGAHTYRSRKKPSGALKEGGKVGSLLSRTPRGSTADKVRARNGRSSVLHLSAPSIAFDGLRECDVMCLCAFTHIDMKLTYYPITASVPSEGQGPCKQRERNRMAISPPF